MAFKRSNKRTPRHLTTEEAEALFATLDETGHVNPQLAASEHEREAQGQPAVAIDPLSGKDPSGSNVNDVIKRTAITFVLVVLAAIMVAQVSCGVARRVNTANLSEQVSVKTVTSALKGGMEWGTGYTQFPTVFSVQEADEATGRIEVSVVDMSSDDEMAALAANQIQSSALAMNAFQNPNITTVVYNVYVHVGSDGKIQHSAFFGFLEPTGSLKSLMSFIWTKTEAKDGTFNWTSTITGIDAETAAKITEKLN